MVESDAACRACGERRGWIYSGPVYAVEQLRDALCPWCLADGRAAATLGASFADAEDAPGDVPADAIDRLVHRTPAFSSWQQGRWLFHCGDAAAFLGYARRAELERHAGAIESLRRELAGWGLSAGEVEQEIDGLEVGDSSAYLFVCRHCGTHLAYADST